MSDCIIFSCSIRESEVMTYEYAVRRTFSMGMLDGARWGNTSKNATAAKDIAPKNLQKRTLPQVFLIIRRMGAGFPYCASYDFSRFFLRSATNSGRGVEKSFFMCIYIVVRGLHFFKKNWKSGFLFRIFCNERC